MSPSIPPRLTWALLEPASPKCHINLRIAHGVLATHLLNRSIWNPQVYEVNFNRWTQPTDLRFFPLNLTDDVKKWLQELHQYYDTRADSQDLILRVCVTP
jgi:hypothetical protein